MKGVVLAGGTGSRLRPMTEVVNKHVLPVYNKPMIYYPVETLLRSGVTDIMVVSTPEDIGRYIQLLENDFEANFRYRVQKEPKGIADALSLAEDFVDEKVLVSLGDNIILEDLSDAVTAFSASDAEAKIFLKEVERPSRYGVAELEEGELLRLTEKPDEPSSNYAITGVYLYDASVFNIIPELEPSDRGELEITDVNERYLNQGTLSYRTIESEWFDVGTPEGLHKASRYVRKQRLQERE